MVVCPFRTQQDTMIRRRLTILVALITILAGCGPSGEKVAGSHVPPTTTTSSTTTTTAPTTTTTAPFSLDGAPEDLTQMVEAFYDYAIGEPVQPPPAAPPILEGFEPIAGIRPEGGMASVANFAGSRIAVIEIDEDLLLAVDSGEGWTVVGGEWPSLGIPPYYGPSPRLVAVVGSDARPHENVADTRNDSIHFVGLDGAGGGGVLGLPRDSYVPVPGYGTRKITGALALGGPDVMMEAFLDLTDLPLEGYVLTGFSGFQGLIDAVLGGVEVEVPFAINDTAAKASLAAGLQVLNGFDALAFARARKTMPAGDFTRSYHQGVILLGAARGIQSMGPRVIPGMMEAAEPYLLTNLSPAQLLTFSVLTTRADLSSIPNVVAPGSPGRAGAASVVYLHDGAYDLFADLADGNLEP